MSDDDSGSDDIHYDSKDDSGSGDDSGDDSGDSHSDGDNHEVYLGSVREEWSFGNASKLRDLLDGVKSRGQFAVGGTAPFNLGLAVGGRPLPLPLLPGTDLSGYGLEPAPFGKGDALVVDPAVRSCLQSTAVSFLNPAAEDFLRELGENASRQLGVEGAVELRLHKLVVYHAEGDHFDRHKDAVHSAGVFGSLVLQMPSQFAGNQLVVHYGDQSRRFFTSSWDLQWAAFYGDLDHEVEPLESLPDGTVGPRVAITFDIARPSTVGDIPRTPSLPVVEMPSLPNFGVVLCVHHYPAYALRPKRLYESEREEILAAVKGEDAARVGFLLDHLPDDWTVGLRHISLSFRQGYEDSLERPEMFIKDAIAVYTTTLQTRDVHISNSDIVWPRRTGDVEMVQISYTSPAGYVGNEPQAGECELQAACFFWWKNPRLTQREEWYLTPEVRPYRLQGQIPESLRREVFEHPNFGPGLEIENWEVFLDCDVTDPEVIVKVLTAVKHPWDKGNSSKIVRLFERLPTDWKLALVDAKGETESTYNYDFWLGQILPEHSAHVVQTMDQKRCPSHRHRLQLLEIEGENFLRRLPMILTDVWKGEYEMVKDLQALDRELKEGERSLVRGFILTLEERLEGTLYALPYPSDIKKSERDRGYSYRMKWDYRFENWLKSPKEKTEWDDMTFLDSLKEGYVVNDGDGTIRKVREGFLKFQEKDRKLLQWARGV